MVTIAGFEIDAALAVDPSFDSEVTSHPVEEGADITDHVRSRPITVSIEGVVSDTPIGPLADTRAANSKPSDDALAWLRGIRAAREPVTISTSRHVFENMVLTSLAAPEDRSTGDSLRFRATFQQIDLVTNERTTVQVAVPAAAKKVNRGNKPTDPADAIPAQAARDESTLNSLVHGRRPTQFFGLRF